MVAVNHAGFEAELLALREDLARRALSLSRNPADAEDLAQDTVLRALAHREQFKEGSNLRAWLMRIMHNRFLDGRRRRKYEPVAADFQGVELEAPPSVREEIPRPDMDEVLEEIDPAHRAMFILYQFRGFTYREIAEILGRPLGSVMSGIFRARQKLRTLLKGK
jgi:RNA polymerase sigma-70 factor (ECF subfamily)